MRAALVKPEWRVLELRDTFEQVSATVPTTRECVLVAVDPAPDGYAALCYDPIEDEFVLADGSGTTIGVRGDAVGCFMAR